MENRGHLIVNFIVISLLFILLISGYFYSANEDYRSEFNGIVTSVKFSEKNIPTVFVNDESYMIWLTDWKFYTSIEQGDSIVKKKNSMKYILIKKETGQIMISQ